MADWEKEHEEKVEFIEKTIREIEKEVPALAILIQDMLDEALAIYYGKEKVRASAAAYAKIDQTFKKMEEYIAQTKYATKVEDMTRSFETLVKYNTRIQKGMNGLTVSTKKLSPFMMRAVDTTISTLISSGLKAEILRPMRDMMIRSIAGGATLKDAKDSYLTYVRASNKRSVSRLEQWVIEMSRDTMLGVDGAINSFIHEEYEMDGYRYVGSLVKDSRPQCRRWVAMEVIPNDKLEEEIKLAYRTGKGMMPGTNTTTFSIQRGGFNCRHYAYPTFIDKK